MQYFLKIFLTSLIVLFVSEISKRSQLVAAVIASLPFTSILAMSWLYYETQNIDKVATLSYNIFWMVIPSLVFFIIFPIIIKFVSNFPIALLLSCIVMSFSYWGHLQLLKKFGISL